MQKIYLLLLITGAILLGGCDKQTKINSEKIQILSQNIIQIEQHQAKQMAAIQSQLASLAPRLDKINNFYFEKSHDDAFIYHTNTLFLLLTVGQKIESQLQLADIEREAQNTQAYYYHTNQTATMYFCAAQIRDALGDQEKQIEDNVNAEARQMNATLRDELLKQIKLSAPTAIETARLKETETDVAQIKHDLDTIKAQLGQIANPPAARP